MLRWKFHSVSTDLPTRVYCHSKYNMLRCSGPDTKKYPDQAKNYPDLQHPPPVNAELE
jgi:hypothetical protein